MTCGIYILYYETDDFQYYIGKSINIESRYKDHCSKLLNKSHKNNGLVSGFNMQKSLPSYDILEVTLEAELYTREEYWITLFDCYHNGMNETPGGEGVGVGEVHPMSIYTNDKITEVFNILVNQPDLTYVEIERLSKVSKHVIRDIARGKTHCWLSQTYPKEYSILQSTTINKVKQGKSAKSMGITYPAVLSPDGKIYYVDNVRKFARDHNLYDSNLGSLLHGRLKTCAGWKLAPV